MSRASSKPKKANQELRNETQHFQQFLCRTSKSFPFTTSTLRRLSPLRRMSRGWVSVRPKLLSLFARIQTLEENQPPNTISGPTCWDPQKCQIGASLHHVGHPPPPQQTAPQAQQSPPQQTNKQTNKHTAFRAHPSPLGPTPVLSMVTAWRSHKSKPQPRAATRARRCRKAALAHSSWEKTAWGLANFFRTSVLVGEPCPKKGQQGTTGRPRIHFCEQSNDPTLARRKVPEGPRVGRSQSPRKVIH